jgi:Cu+-exporting ATPase
MLARPRTWPSTRFAFLYNAARVPIAAGALYPLFGILLSPMVGAAAMALSPSA